MSYGDGLPHPATFKTDVILCVNQYDNLTTFTHHAQGCQRCLPILTYEMQNSEVNNV
jgi:hypothetical protein